MTKYLQNCFLLLVPILLWNVLLTEQLPSAFQPDFFWKDIPSFITIPENVLRILVMASPVFLILSVKTKIQRIGLTLYIAGTILYFASWLVLIYFPGSAWSQNAIGFMAPAYTPLIWLIGIGLIGRQSFFNLKNASRIYILLSIAFILFHSLHTYWVFELI